MKLGIAVSGGPDSLALMLLAERARPGQIEAATVDHSLRTESTMEARTVSALCSTLGVPHAILRVEWAEKPASAIQERARAERYALLGGWAAERGLGAIAVAHHADDQAETLLMRLNRGAGVTGLAAMRVVSPLPGAGSAIPLLRPLLDWRRSELVQVCDTAGVQPVQDPGNCDERFERVRVRLGLSSANWLEASGIAASAHNLAEADEALDWATEREWQAQVVESGDGLVYRPDGPAEIRRRILVRAIRLLATEGQSLDLRGREIVQLASALSDGGTATLRGVRCSGGLQWRFTPAPPRRANR